LLWSKDETSLSSSIAIFRFLADLYLNAFKKVSGWKRSLRFTGFSKRFFYWTLYNQESNAFAFLL